ncbi:HSP20 family protein [Actinopolyspora xinjiangensis]|uniref:HSP20 family protein n=1 Tax=Actinopolyspora xinjiangensis TaxID=405564 RepID=A0A1H0X2V9_9ACTN|nr:Hsp20/alpha crystallin family protein [Actinopolyspora xinjiangensis]SDP97065.1 HSP20 family protein [Actinopolyspora xinjiangensis]
MAEPVPVRRGERGAMNARPVPAFWQEPFRELEDMWDRMERMFDPGWSTTGAGGMWQPLVDVTETEDAYEFEVEVPGVDRDDINVEIRDHELWITGEVRERERSGVLHRRTRRTGSFSYRSSLPSGVDSENVEAKLDSGVLTVRVRKSERQKPHRVEIQ